MTRLFIGWKSGAGGVLKIMKSDADNPLTTPNTDYGKFLFNSETAAVGYGDFVASQTFSPRTLPYDSNITYYPPGSTVANGKFVSWTYSSPTRYRDGIMNNAWPVKNAFHFAYDDSTDFRYIWRMYQTDYAGSSDARTVSVRDFPSNRIAPFKKNGSWYVSSFYSASGNDFSGTTVSDPALDGTLARSLTAAAPSAFPASLKTVCYTLDMPVDDSPYPAVSPGTPVAGQKMLRIDPTTARLAKAGFNVDTATDAQCIFSSNKLPMKVIKTGFVTVNAGATLNVAMGRTLAQSTFVDYQVNIVGGNVWVPPWPEADSAAPTSVAYRFSGTDLQLYNSSVMNLQVRYVVMAQDDLAVSSGTARVLDANFSTGTITLRRPGTAGSRLSDTIVSSDLAYLPMVAQAYVPITSFVASDIPKIGNIMHRVTLSNPGGLWKPYVLAKLECRNKADNNLVYYMDPYGKSLDNTSTFAASNFLIRIIGDTSVTFYCSNDNRNEDAYRTGGGVWNLPKWQWEPIGLRYYIFAIPNSL